MKKNMEMPEVKVIEFEVKDVIVTSGNVDDSGSDGTDVQARRSVFED